MTTTQYCRLRAISLRVARSYRVASAWGPADPAKVREEQRRMAALRAARL